MGLKIFRIHLPDLPYTEDHNECGSSFPVYSGFGFEMELFLKLGLRVETGRAYGPIGSDCRYYHENYLDVPEARLTEVLAFLRKYLPDTELKITSKEVQGEVLS